jgi:hypothetical protein
MLQAGNAEGAFEIWYRELRLRRALGYLEEVRALGRVGEIAWQRTQKFDAQVITGVCKRFRKRRKLKNRLIWNCCKLWGKLTNRCECLAQL